MKRFCHIGPVLILLLTLPLRADASDPDKDLHKKSMVAFGGSVLLDGDRAFVGRTAISTRYPEPVWQMAGVHVYQRENGAWIEVEQLSASAGELGDRFGHALAISGGLLAVSAPLANMAAGAIYLFADGEFGWEEIAVVSIDGSAAGDSVGWALEFVDSTLLVGSPGFNEDAGTVYALQPDQNGDWSKTSRLEMEALRGDLLGQAISCDGGLCFVGAPGANGGGGMVVRAHLTGSGQFKVRSVVASSGETRRGFGYALAAGAGKLVVGAPNGSQADSRSTEGPYEECTGRAACAYVYEIDEDDNLSEPIIVGRPEGYKYSTSETDFAFGAHVAVNGSEIWVGARGASDAGMAFVYRLGADGRLSEPQPLSIYNMSLGGGFGGPISVDGSTALVGVTRLDFGGGRTYFLERDEDGHWLESQMFITPPMIDEAITGTMVECEDGKADMFSCNNVDLLAFLPLNDIGGAPGITAADIWGWTDPDTGREYVLATRMDGTAFIDVTDPVNPVYLGNLAKTATSVPNVHRDAKTYRHYALIVADIVGSHGMQVFDLHKLRDVENPPVEFEVDHIYRGVESAHNVIVNEEADFAYIVGADGVNSCGGGLHMVDIEDPLDPKFAGCFNHPNTGSLGTGATHDAQCVIYDGPDERYTGREICLSSNGTALSIADVSDKDNPVPISAGVYPDYSYAHQGWLTEDHRYFFLDDESDEMQKDFGGTRTMIWDLAELDDPILVGVYVSENQASDHNLYIRGNLMYQSNYVAGLRILDISDPENPVEVGHFDTMPWGKDEPGYAGSWSNYPYFESGTIAVSSIREGVFLVKKSDPAVP